MRALLAALIALGCQSGFEPEDVDHLESSVRVEFLKRPQVRSVDVSFVRESSRKLVGFAKLRTDTGEVTKSCTATMGENNQALWTCN